jgi:hypothetical protein
MVLHEMNPPDRIPALREMIRVLDDDGILLIMDFDLHLDSDRGYAALIIRIIERIAGKEHHQNFRNFLSVAGIPGLLQKLDCTEWKRHPILRNRGGVFELRQNKRQDLSPPNLRYCRRTS